MVRNSFSRRLRHRLRGTCAISAAKRKVASSAPLKDRRIELTRAVGEPVVRTACCINRRTKL